MPHVQDIRAGLALFLGVPESQVDAVVSRLTPIVSLDEMFKVAPAGRQYAMGQSVQLATAGVLSQVQLHNTTAANKRVHLYRQLLAVGAANTEVAMGLTATILGGTGAWGWVDPRAPGAPGAQVRDDINAVTQIVTRVGTQIGGTNNVHPLELDVVLEPGEAWMVETTAINLDLYATFWWTEEPMD